MSEARRISWSRLLRWSVTIALVVWLLTLIDIRETLRILVGTRLDLVVVVLTVLMAIRFVMAWRWHYVLRALAVESRFLDAFRITMVSIALSLVMPGGHAAVDAYRTWAMSRLRGNMSAVTASVAVDRIFGLYSLVLIAFVAVLIAPTIPGGVDWRLSIGWGFVIATIVTAVLVATGPRMISGCAPLLSWWPRGQGAMLQVAQRLQDRELLRRMAIPSTLLALPVQILRGVEFYLIYAAVGAHVDLIFMLIYAPLVFLLMLLPVSAGGVGLREGAFYLFLTPHGVSVDSIVAAGILFQVLGVIMGLPGAIWISKGPVPADSAASTAKLQGGGPNRDQAT